MTDFTPGPIITRDNPLCDVWPPSWLRHGTQHQHVSDLYNYDWDIWDTGARSVDFDAKEPASYWHGITAIRLDASDIVYRCLEWNEAHPDEPIMWPWYGGDEAPADVGERVLFQDGENWPSSDGWDWKNFDAGDNIIGYQRRPTTSLPEPAEEGRREWFPHRDITGDEMRLNCFREPYPMQEEIDRLKAACERAGMVAVSKMTRAEAEKWLSHKVLGDALTIEMCVLHSLGIIRPDPTPLDIAKAEYPEIPAEKIERIMQIAGGK